MNEKLDREAIGHNCFLSRIMVGGCPKCGSENSHTCEAPISESCKIIVPYPRVQQEDKIMRVGSECEIAMKLNNVGVGHCDDCGYLWCLDCGSELSIEEPDCGHHEICEGCEDLKEMINDEGNIMGCAFVCTLSVPEWKCPRIRKWKETNRVNDQT